MRQKIKHITLALALLIGHTLKGTPVKKPLPKINIDLSRDHPSLPSPPPKRERPKPRSSPYNKKRTPSSFSLPTKQNQRNLPEEVRSRIRFKRPSPRTKVTFNLQNADLNELVRLISEITGKRFIIGGRVRNIKATVYAPTKVTIREAYKAFLSILRVNGLTVIPAGPYLKIIEADEGLRHSAPVYKQDGFPFEDRMITRLHKLKHISSDNIIPVVEKFKSRMADVISYGPTNTLIITDFRDNIQKILKIIAEIDVPGIGEQIWVEKIYYATASQLAEKLKEVFIEKTRPSPPRTPSIPSRPQRPQGHISKIIAEDRTNTLIIIASKQAYLRILELIKKLDVAIPGEGEIHVHYLQNADAEELSKSLSGITQGVAPKRPGRREPHIGRLFEGQVKITADKATNSLIIVSSLKDYLNLKRVIESLDLPRRQVFVEAMIMEVSLEKMRDLGLVFHAGKKFSTDQGDGYLFGGTTFMPLSSVIITPTALAGLAVGLRGPEIEGTEGLFGLEAGGVGMSLPSFGVMIQALQTNNDVNILSTPYVLATDNITAEITVGGNVPIQQGFTTTLPGVGTTPAQRWTGLTPLVSVGRKDVGLTLKITPQINESDQVRLEIEIQISEVTGQDPSGLGPIISHRTAKTTSVVKDQQTVVIGGLITDNETESVSKVPILGDIPIIGHFFKKTSKRVVKRNLLLFLTPHIIRDPSDFRRIFNQKMEERREFIHRYTAFLIHKVEPHIDYRRKNGILEEINQTLKRIKEEEKTREEIKKRKKKIKRGGPPLGAPPSTLSPGTDLKVTPPAEKTFTPTPNQSIKIYPQTPKKQR